MKNDWQEAKKRHKMQQDKARMGVDAPTISASESEQRSRPDSDNAYDKDMDAMRCILYLHGGTVVTPDFANSFSCLLFVFRRLLLWKR